jgi:hypothetical protein
MATDEDIIWFSDGEHPNLPEGAMTDSCACRRLLEDGKLGDHVCLKTAKDSVVRWVQQEYAQMLDTLVANADPPLSTAFIQAFEAVRARPIRWPHSCEGRLLALVIQEWAEEPFQPLVGHLPWF